MRWVYAIFCFFILFRIQFLVIKILQKSKHTTFFVPYTTIDVYICVPLGERVLICIHVYKVRTLFSYLYIQFDLLSSFCIRLPVQFRICHICFRYVCVLVCLYGVLFFAIVGRACSKSNIARNSICNFVHAFDSSFIRSVARLFWFDWNEKEMVQKWHNSDEINYRLFFFSSFFLLCMYVSVYMIVCVCGYNRNFFHSHVCHSI